MGIQKNFMDWENPGIAVITGASSGMGAEFSRILASQGFNTVLVARREDKLKNLAVELEESFNIDAEVLVTDLSDLQSIKLIANKIEKMENVDVLINNAGFGTRGYFDNTPFKPQIDMLFVHNVAAVYLTRAVLPSMVKRGRGAIVFLSSMSAFLPNPQGVMYTATKVFLNGFAECLSLELEDTGVYVQALCPGYVTTEFHEKGDFEGYDRSQVPTWMPANEVIKLSLEALKENKVIFIPGEKYQNVFKLINDPKYGKKIRERNIARYRIPRKKK